MIICIPLYKQVDNTELMFALRSIDKFDENKVDVFIIGEEIPLWVTGVTHVCVKDISGRKQLSIRRKIMSAFNFSDKIFFTNDDIFILRPFDVNEYPYYYYRNLTRYIEAGAFPLIEKLIELRKPTKHYDIHTPIVYERDKFYGMNEYFPAECIIKSMYCNFNEVVSTDMADLKINRPISSDEIKKMIAGGRPCFSTGQFGIQYALPVLKELFPYKSRFEV